MNEEIIINEAVLTQEKNGDAYTVAEDVSEMPAADDGAYITQADEDAVDIPSLEKDMEELTKDFPDIVSSMTPADPERYSALRAMGLSPKEAYMATSVPKRAYDSRKHLTDSMPRSAKSPECGMTRQEMTAARELFDGISDAEIQRLYKKVTK